MAWYTRPSPSERAANRARTLEDFQTAVAITAGIVLPIRKAGKLYRAAKPHATKLQIAAGAVAGKGVVSSAVRSQPWYFVPRDVLFTTYVTRYHPELLSRAGTSPGLPSMGGVHPASIQLAQPSAQKTRRAQGLLRRGSAKRGRVRQKPWCRVHKRRHWCRYTRK